MEVFSFLDTSVHALAAALNGVVTAGVGADLPPPVYVTPTGGGGVPIADANPIFLCICGVWLSVPHLGWHGVVSGSYIGDGRPEPGLPGGYYFLSACIWGRAHFSAYHPPAPLCGAGGAACFAGGATARAPF